MMELKKRRPGNSAAEVDLYVDKDGYSGYSGKAAKLQWIESPASTSPLHPLTRVRWQRRGNALLATCQQNYGRGSRWKSLVVVVEVEIYLVQY